jgi:hypothetical protein
MNSKRLATLATAVLLAISGVAAGGAQADPFEPGLPLSPVGQIPLSPVGQIPLSPVGQIPLSPVGQIPLSPLSQQQAVRAAKNYLDYTAFSYQGLIKQLVVGDGYSTEDATLAVDSITVDWNAQAAKAAKNYLDYTSFSHSGLITQLTVGDGYTSAQAEYGVAAAGL